MSNKNILYLAKASIKEQIEEVFDAYNQLPLKDVSYPFAVFELLLLDNSATNKMQVTIDCWNNELNQDSFQRNVDDLVNQLDYTVNSGNNLSIAYIGNIESIQDIPTQEESLTRIRLIGEYDIIKNF